MSEQDGIHTEPDAPEVEQPEAVQFTEDAQGKAFVDNHDGNLRYVNENDQWYSYNGIYWEAINTLKVIEAARLMNRGTAISLDKNSKLSKQLSTRGFARSVEAFARGESQTDLAGRGQGRAETHPLGSVQPASEGRRNGQGPAGKVDE